MFAVSFEVDCFHDFLKSLVGVKLQVNHLGFLVLVFFASSIRQNKAKFASICNDSDMHISAFRKLVTTKVTKSNHPANVF